MAILRPFANCLALEMLAKSYPELDITSVETCLAFLQTTADVQTALETHFSRYNLSMGKFTLLMQLLQADEGGLTPSQCATLSGVTRATITGLLDGLERDGFLERKTRSDDRRMFSIHLIEKGSTVLHRILPDHFSRTTQLMSHLTTSEKKSLIVLLQKLQLGTSFLSNL